jgi:hypothetical protein
VPGGDESDTDDEYVPDEQRSAGCEDETDESCGDEESIAAPATALSRPPTTRTTR